jgi:DNA-binding Lrp family transcriptional regulator
MKPAARAAPANESRAAWQVVAEVTGKTEAQCREIIKTWVKNGVLEAYSYESPTARRDMQGLNVNPDKRPK